MSIGLPSLGTYFLAGPTPPKHPSNGGFDRPGVTDTGSLGCAIVLPVPGPGFRGRFGAGPRAGLPGPVWGRFGPETQCGRIKIRSQVARADGPGSLGLDFGFVRVVTAVRLAVAPRRGGQTYLVFDHEANNKN